MAEIGLADVVRALRLELSQAMDEGADQTVRFEMNSVDLEFQVGVTKTADAKGGVKFWVLEMGAGGSHGTETLQTIKLSLTPQRASGGRVRIAGATEANPLSDKAQRQ